MALRSLKARGHAFRAPRGAQGCTPLSHTVGTVVTPHSWMLSAVGAAACFRARESENPLLCPVSTRGTYVCTHTHCSQGTVSCCMVSLGFCFSDVFYFYFMCFACIYVCTLHVYYACREQRRVQDPPELELRGYSMWALGPEPVLCESSKCS